MDKDLEKLINRTLDEVFDESIPRDWRTATEIYEDICPTCKCKIHEHDEYTDDGGTTWRHTACNNII